MLETTLDILMNTQLPLPGVEVMLMVVLVSLSLIFRYNRCGIVVAYIFSYRWGWLVADHFPEEAQFAYIIFGVLVGALAAMALLSERKN